MKFLSNEAGFEPVFQNPDETSVIYLVKR